MKNLKINFSKFFATFAIVTTLFSIKNVKAMEEFHIFEFEPIKNPTTLDELIHPTIDRSLTVREVARLQSFPDLYDFKGGPVLCPHIYETQDKYEQIGDAVPPLLAYHWGLTIRDILGK